MAPRRMSREGRRAAAAAPAGRAGWRRVKRGDADERPTRVDAYYNQRTGLGGTTDPAYWTQFCADVVGDDEARELWLGNDFAGKVVELKARAAYRAGFRVVTKDKGRDDEIAAYLRELDAGTKLMQAAFRAAAFGGGALLPVVNDGSKNLSEPLRTNGRISSIDNIHVLEPLELYPVSHYQSIFDKKWRQPKRYRLQSIAARGGPTAEAGSLIHESRLIVFRGIDVGAAAVTNTSNGWSTFSQLTRCARVINQFGSSWQGIETLMHRIEQGVLHLANLSTLIGEDGETGAVRAALQEMNAFRGLVDMLVIGTEDKYERLAVPLQGAADVLKLFMYRVSAATGIPATKLFGRSPDGMNATGDSDNDNWDDEVGEARELQYEEPTEQLVELAMMANDGPLKGKVPDEWSIAWAPLTQPSQKDIAETNYVQSQADEKNIAAGLYTAAIARRNRFGGDRGEINLTTTITDKEMRELEQLDEAQQEAEQAMLEAGAAGAAAGAQAAADPAAAAKPKAEPAEPKADQERRDFDRPPVAVRDFAGMRVGVENPAGTDRAWGPDARGRTGVTRMTCDYGRVEGTSGADGDCVDCYLGPDEDAPFVHVVHQLDPETGVYDEDKAMIGWRSADAAQAAYLAHRDDDGRAYGGMSQVPLAKFREKVARPGGARGRKVTHADRGSR